MKSCILFLLLCVATVSVRPALALEWKADIVLSPAPIAYSGPADSVTGGNLIGTNWSTTETVNEVFWCGWLLAACSKGTMEPSSAAVPSGQTVVMDGVTYYVFESGVPGIGYILGLKDTGASTWLPLQTQLTQTFPASGSGIANSLGWSAKVTFVKTGVPMQAGTYTTPLLNIATLHAMTGSDDAPTATATASVIINPTTIEVIATGCTISMPVMDINLGTVDMHTLASVNSTSPLETFYVNLQCDANISLNAVLTDQTDQSNTSDIVSLTPTSTASGVGVQFFYAGSGPLSLGPDSSLSGTINQFYITATTSSAESLTLPFQVRYIRTGEITPGSANALASLTFSYQ
ncbi:fimbrial protein [Phytobacter sp. V91]|uniref:fimbrial protein n=1 Tax=Phytobacter sp. V91 TaxID=3369425 RepID=UPI003F5DAB4B